MHEEPRESSEQSASCERPLRVLFVDDERALGALVREYFTRKGHDVRVAQTGEEGLKIAIEEDFDAIVCDMHLPGISGEDLHMGLIEEKPAAAERLLIATGDVVSPHTRSFFERTGLPHIHKPFKLAQLETAVARLLAGRPVGDV